MTNSTRHWQGSVKYQIGDFELDCRNGMLSQGNLSVRLEPMLLDLLRVLVEFKGEIVSREVLLEKVWENRQVTDDAIRAAIKKLRDMLGDDARNPQYIKTQPMKGYCLIAPSHPLIDTQSNTLSEVTNTAKPDQSLWLWAGAALAMVAALILFSRQSEFSAPLPKARPVQALTQMTGSEVMGDFSPHQNLLLFQNRADNYAPLQLYVKALNSRQVRRLTFDQYNYSAAYWSTKGDQIAFTQTLQTQVSHYVASISFEDGIGPPRPLPAELSDKVLMSWSADDQLLYFRDTYRDKLPKGIYQYHLGTETLTQLTAPSVEGIGDYLAKESHDGQTLALMRDVGTAKRELTLMDLDTGAIIANQIAPLAVKNMVWAQDNQTLYMTSFVGDFYRFSVADGTFHLMPRLPSNTNDVFYHCGDGCFYLRQHNGNFLDIVEQPNPFEPDGFQATTLMNYRGAEEFPSYSHSGDNLYFASMTGQSVQIRKLTPGKSMQQLAHFPLNAELRGMAVNPDETFLVGQQGARLFLLDLQTSELRFLTNEVQRAAFPTWLPDGSGILFTLLEKGQGNIYQLSLDGSAPKLVAENLLSARAMEDGTLMGVDAQLNMVSINAQQEASIVMKMQEADVNLWKVVGRHLYVSLRKGTAAYLRRLHLDNGEQQEILLDKHRFRLTFDVHPNEQTLLVVNSVGAESNLVKVQQ